jgi:hypothetical protein
MQVQREVVVLVPRKSGQVEHDDEVHATLVQPAVREQVLKLAAIVDLALSPSSWNRSRRTSYP